MIAAVIAAGSDKLDLADDIQEEFQDKAKAAIGDAADVLLTDIKSRLRRRRQDAAPAGEPPAEHTSKLLESYKRITPRVVGPVAISGIRSRHLGANRLEVGFTDERGIRTLPHPHVRPAIAATRAEIDALLQERLG